MTPKYWSRALSGLSKQDPVLKILIRRNRHKKLQARKDPFVTLARAIISQQISVKAAATVLQRLADATEQIELADGDALARVSGSHEFASICPQAIASMDMTQLRGCGLSGRKATYLVELSGLFLNGTLNPETWQSKDDEELIQELTEIKGIGRWTAEVFLMFCMLRPDVLPMDDVGLQRAMRIHYNNGEALTRSEMGQISENWRPWRSAATWFMWRSLDAVPPA